MRPLAWVYERFCSPTAHEKGGIESEPLLPRNNWCRCRRRVTCDPMPAARRLSEDEQRQIAGRSQLVGRR